MARKVLAGVTIVAALGAVGPAAADQLPILRAAKAVHRHVAIAVSVADIRPTELVVAKRRAVNADGALLAKNVRLLEPIQIAASQTGVVHWRSSGKLRPGTYFVQVQAVDSGVLTGCPPKLRNCGEHWSNVRRIVVPRPR
jgi:hypothetical protein